MRETEFMNATMRACPDIVRITCLNESDKNANTPEKPLWRFRIQPVVIENRVCVLLCSMFFGFDTQSLSYRIDHARRRPMSHFPIGWRGESR
jgi:hypothetical protein